MPLREDRKIQHIGIVAEDLDEALSFFGLTRDDVVEEVFDPNQQNLLVFVHLPANDLWLEFVIPQAESSTTWRFAKKFGVGLHHLGFNAGSLDEAASRMTGRPGIFELGRYAIEVRSFGGSIRTLFFAARGLIVEFVERVAAKYAARSPAGRERIDDARRGRSFRFAAALLNEEGRNVQTAHSDDGGSGGGWAGRLRL